MSLAQLETVWLECDPKSALGELYTFKKGVRTDVAVNYLNRLKIGLCSRPQALAKVLN
jgi:hypothetical protein